MTFLLPPGIKVLKIADIDPVAKEFKYHRICYCDFTKDYLSWIINRKFSRNLFFYLKEVPANNEFYRGIPPATKCFNHSSVGTRRSAACFCGFVAYFIIYRTNWKSKRNQRTNKQCEHELFTNKKDPINIENIVETLQKRNLLRHTKTIQISSNVKFTSIQFNTSQIMETFCTEDLTINDIFQTTFIPDFQKRKRKPIKSTYISFLNVPSETEESALTRFVEEYPTVAG